MHPILLLIISLIVAYTLSVLFIYTIQDRLIFRRERIRRKKDYVFDRDFKEYFIDTKDGVKIHALLFRSEHSVEHSVEHSSDQSSSNSSRGLILYFHGNANNLQRWGRYSGTFTGLGYDVLMVDYRGYGKSTGVPTEALLYSDAEAIWTWAKETFDHRKFIIYGRSLGAAVASNLAGKVDPELLIMETPFDNLNRALPAYIIPFQLKYHFENSKHLPEVQCKIAIFHGTMDMLIPIYSAMRLKPLLKETDKMVIIKKGRHNNLDSFPEYREELQNILFQV